MDLVLVGAITVGLSFLIPMTKITVSNWRFNRKSRTFYRHLGR